MCTSLECPRLPVSCFHFFFFLLYKTARYAAWYCKPVLLMHYCNYKHWFVAQILLQFTALHCFCVSRPLSVSGACLAICCDESGKCVQLNWSSILLDGYKKLSLPRQWSWQPSCENRRVKTFDSRERKKGKGSGVWPSMVTHTRNLSSAFNPSKCTLTAVNTHPEQWAAILRHPGSSWGIGALLKGLTSVVVLKVERALVIHSPNRQSLPDLGIEPATFGLQVQLSNH